ncbi:site-2 protease family protein [Patescibacteria group bacterium]|nr:site-2 protease family protein [Patescibacteria group bacterium]MBU1922331.1 site-2 protease family protein [Patescibacteria group bacterium]
MILSLLAQNPLLFVVWVIAIIFALTVHEFFHALAAYFLGDKTAQRAGRLTLNPLSHIDPVGFLMLMIAGIGWAKPVPFNPYNLKYSKWGPALVALAGPASNLASFFILGAVAKLLLIYGFAASNLLIVLLIFTIYINAILLFFNVLPIPPLDGSKILYAILSHPKYNNLKLRLELQGTYVLLGLLILNWVTNGLILSPIFIGTYYLFKTMGLETVLAGIFSFF